MTIRVRFAPSPTGHLHIGGLRVALFNWLFARHNGGLFLMRIEDTDFQRSTLEFTNSILDSFEWVGMRSDEPIVVQSQRIPEHLAHAHSLVAADKAYYCYCTQEELAQRLGATAATGTSYTRYDGLCRRLESKKAALDLPYVIRFKIPEQQSAIVFHDLIRGDISFDPALLDDFIIVRSDLVPTYNFVVVLDDFYMGITHVIRGEEHISNTPKQILLYEALGYPLPAFAHAPLILAPDGSKLSKRDAATSVLDYRKNGFLPEALINYLVRLGWASGDQELFTLPEMIAQFTLQGIGKKGSIFDSKKLEWVNSVYIKQKSPAELLDYIIQIINPDFLKKLPAVWSSNIIESAIVLYKERVKTVKELEQEILSFTQLPTHYTVSDCQKWITPDTRAHLERTVQLCDILPDWTTPAITQALKQVCTEFSLAYAQIAQPLRISLTGKTSSPGVAELCELLGKKEFSIRIFTFIEKHLY